jgi:hypothetical protein
MGFSPSILWHPELAKIVGSITKVLIKKTPKFWVKKATMFVQKNH